MSLYKNHKAWRLRNPKIRNEGKKRNYNQTSNNNTNHYIRWNQYDDYLVLNSDMSDRDLHHVIGRSVQSIQVRRTKLKYSLVEMGGIK